MLCWVISMYWFEEKDYSNHMGSRPRPESQALEDRTFGTISPPASYTFWTIQKRSIGLWRQCRVQTPSRPISLRNGGCKRQDFWTLGMSLQAGQSATFRGAGSRDPNRANREGGRVRESLPSCWHCTEH